MYIEVDPAVLYEVCTSILWKWVDDEAIAERDFSILQQLSPIFLSTKIKSHYNTKV